MRVWTTVQRFQFYHLTVDNWELFRRIFDFGSHALVIQGLSEEVSGLWWIHHLEKERIVQKEWLNIRIPTNGWVIAKEETRSTILITFSPMTNALQATRYLDRLFLTRNDFARARPTRFIEYDLRQALGRIDNSSNGVSPVPSGNVSGALTASDSSDACSIRPEQLIWPSNNRGREKCNVWPLAQGNCGHQCDAPY